MATVRLKILISQGHKNREGFADAHLWSPSEKTKRAWRATAICVGLALVSILLPMAHFFLVPGFLIACPFVFSWIKRQTGKVISMQGHCPNCSATLTSIPLTIGQNNRAPCPDCFEPLIMHVEAQSH